MLKKSQFDEQTRGSISEFPSVIMQLWAVFENNIFTTVIALCVLYVFLKFMLAAEQAPPRQHEENNKYTKICSSPNCVRCTTYSIVLAKSDQAFTKYIAEHSGKGLERLQEDYGKLPDKTSLQQPNVLYLRSLTARPFWSNADSALVQRSTDCLIQQHQAIVKEYKGVLSDVSAWKTNTTDTGSWNTFYLYNQGVKDRINCHKCPTVTNLLEKSLESVFMKNCVFGNAFFSRLSPGTTISEHFGPCNARLRVHLGLSIPPGWQLTVGDRTHTWQVNQCLVFDDSFLHCVSFDATSPPVEPRVVLIVDIWHPDLTVDEQNAICAIYTNTNS